MYLVVTTIVVAVTAALLVAVYRVLKAAHTRPPRQDPHDSHDSAPGSHAHPASPHQHSRAETAVLTTVTKLIRLMIRRGVHLGPMMMLTVRGRKTGVARTTLVDVFERDGRRWLVATHDASASWVRNLRAAGQGTLALGRNSFSFTAAELPQREAGRVLRDVLGPRLARPLAGFVLRQTLGVPPGAAPDEFERAAADHPVFEITVTPDNRARQDAAGTRVRGDSMKLPIAAIVIGILVAGVHVILGATGVMTKPEWISGVVIGILVAGVGNHSRIFGRQFPAKQQKL